MNIRFLINPIKNVLVYVNINFGLEILIRHIIIHFSECTNIYILGVYKLNMFYFMFNKMKFGYKMGNKISIGTRGNIS